MITLQYINDLAVCASEQALKSGHFVPTDLMLRIFKNEKFLGIFILEFNNHHFANGSKKRIFNLEDYL